MPVSLTWGWVGKMGKYGEGWGGIFEGDILAHLRRLLYLEAPPSKLSKKYKYKCL